MIHCGYYSILVLPSACVDVDQDKTLLVANAQLYFYFCLIRARLLVCM